MKDKTATPDFMSWLERSPAAAALIPVAAALLVCAPLLASLLAMVGPDSFRAFDWLESAQLDYFSRLSLLQHWTLPTWNPYLQGGLPQLSHPGDGTLSVLILPTLLLGEEMGMKVNVAAALAAGSLGVYLLSRDFLDLGLPAALFAGCAFALSGWVPSRVAIGYYESTLYAFFPLLLWLLISPLRARLLALAVIIAGALLYQAHVGLICLGAALALFLLLGVFIGGLPRAVLGRALLVGVGGVGLAAVKLTQVPLLLLASRRGRFHKPSLADVDYWYHTLGELWTNLWATVPRFGTYDPSGLGTSADFGYLGFGIPLLVLALAAVLAAPWISGRRNIIVILLAMSSYLCLGPTAGLDVYGHGGRFLFFSLMRGTVRYCSFIIALCVPMLAAVTLQLTEGRLRSLTPVRFLPWVIIAVSLAWPAAQSLRLNWDTFTRELEPLPRVSASDFYQMLVRSGRADIDGRWPDRARGGRAMFDYGNTISYRNMKAGIGTIYQDRGLKTEVFPRGKVVFDPILAEVTRGKDLFYQGEVRCLERSCGAGIQEVGPGRFAIRAQLRPGDVLQLNQNYYEGWRSPQGQVYACAGLVCVRPNSTGPTRVELSYWPPLLTAGLAVSAVTWLLVLGLFLLPSLGVRRTR